jgi:CubicO group peptidase (beta-lactamase class C family)
MQRHLLNRLPLLALALLLTAVSGPLPLTPAMKARIDAIVKSELARQYVPGAQVAIAENGRVVYAKGYGYREIGSRLPVDAQTSFAIGSVTKQFTAAAIMLLEQQGKLNVGDKLAKYLPRAPHASEVTLRNLLTHTSGIVGFTEVPNFSLLLPTPSSPDRIISTIARTPLAFAPGTDWEYSNTNFVLLGQVIAKVSGESYPDFLQQNFFDRLGLKRSWFTRTEAIHPDDARGYTEFMYGLPDEHAYLADWSWYDAAGGLTMSAADLARWDIALDSGRVVSPASFARMTTRTELKNGRTIGYGFGLGVGSVFGRPTVGHDGLVSGFSSENLTFPKDRVAIVLLSNGDNFSYLHAIRAIAAVVYVTTDPQANAPFKPIAQRAAQVRAAKEQLVDMLHGKVDYANMTPDLVLTLPEYRIAQLKEDGRLLGDPLDIQPASVDRRPPLTIYRYRARFKSGLAEWVYTVTDAGKFAGFSLQAWQ